MTPERDDKMLAAEYVLGLLSDEDRADVERRIASSLDFARIVEVWRTRFSEFDETAEEIAPSGDLWLRIEGAIDAPAQVARRPAAGQMRRFWNSVSALRFATLGSTLAAVTLAALAVVALLYAQNPSARNPAYVAILVNDATKQAGAVVNAFADGRVEMVPLADIDVPEGRALQIWTLWDRAVGPRSVGLIARAHATWLSLDDLPATTAGQLFEITLEPAGGSPIGRPTGPVLYKGTASRVL
jgi:anti-sigma-K factor RskA